MSFSSIIVNCIYSYTTKLDSSKQKEAIIPQIGNIVTSDQYANRIHSLTMTELHPGVARFLLGSHHCNKILKFPQHYQRIDFYLNPISEHDGYIHTTGPFTQERISRDLRKTRHV